MEVNGIHTTSVFFFGFLLWLIAFIKVKVNSTKVNGIHTISLLFFLGFCYG